MDKQTVIEIVQYNYEILSSLSEEYTNDKDVIIAAVSADRRAFQYASYQLQQDDDVLFIYLTKFEKIPGVEIYDDNFLLRLAAEVDFAFSYACEYLKNDKEFILKMVQINGLIMKEVGEELKKDQEIAHASILQNSDAFEFIDESLKENKEIILAALKEGNEKMIFESINSSLKLDKEFFTSCIKINPRVILYASDELKEDKEVVQLATSLDPSMFKYVGEKFQNEFEAIYYFVRNGEPERIQNLSKELMTKEIILEAVKQAGNLIEFAGNFKEDKEVVIAAVTNDGSAIEFTSEDFSNDKEIAIISVRNGAWNSIGNKIKHDKDFIISAFKENEYYFFQELNEELRHDKDIIEAAFQFVIEFVKNRNYFRDIEDFVKLLKLNKEQCRKLLEVNEKSLQLFGDDKELVLEEMNRNGKNLSYVSYNLCKDKDVVRAAIKNGGSLIMAGDDLKSDKEFVLEMIELDVSQIIEAHANIRNDREIMFKIAGINGYYAAVCATPTLKADKEFMLEAFKHGATQNELTWALTCDEEFMEELLKINPSIFTETGDNEYNNGNRVYSTSFFGDDDINTYNDD
jgi:hypothetical protein